MQAENNSKSFPPFIQTNDPIALAALLLAELGASGNRRTVIELAAGFVVSSAERLPVLTPRQALRLAARACEYLLTGEPPICTFEPADLEQAAGLLRQMAATIEPKRD